MLFSQEVLIRRTAATVDVVPMFFSKKEIKCRADEGVTPKASRKSGLSFVQKKLFGSMRGRLFAIIIYMISLSLVLKTIKGICII